jgi:DNA-binding response OmpR family regulator
MTSGLKRLLLVGDYADTLDMWAYFLRSSGFEVMTAVSGSEAVGRAEAGRPDLIVLDLGLPEALADSARRLRASDGTAGIPLLALTGAAQTLDADVVRRAGVDVVVGKPCEPSALLVEVERLLGFADAAG